LKNGVHRNLRGEYFVDWVVHSSMPSPGSYEKPGDPNELMIIADGSFYHDPQDSKVVPDGLVKCRLRDESEHRLIPRVLLRCHRNLLSEKSSFFRELFAKTGQVSSLSFIPLAPD
jgi:hypothetical protein